MTLGGMHRAFLAGSVAILSGCGATTSHTSVLGVGENREHATTFMGMPLRTGQIVLSESPDATSFVFSMIPSRFYEFTHAGILAMEGGEPVIYEVSGAVIALPLHRDLLDNISGEVHRRPLLQYAAENLYVEIVDVPAGVDGERVAAFARDAYRRKAPFDSYFRWEEHDALFCTELVELGMRAGGASPQGLIPINDNPSLRLAIRWIKVDQSGALPAGLYRDPGRFVGALGRFRTRTAAYAYFEAKRELFRRFQRNQRLGFLFTVSGNGKVDVRPEVARFAFEAAHLFDAVESPPEPDDPRVAREVRRFAAATFGPVTDAPAP